ncbi:DNA-3-methyladenine glycosylase family protein [Microbacterium halophytorum]|uniref:DNA-3-methyladenine glycosylase family protein n=1 Tax=Microbacterium halophytorum TaxID=2067568 RepID=UPI000CFC1A5E|nr:3-methyladenine DNA glycosylase [Microbacterium halophytorum]
MIRSSATRTNSGARAQAPAPEPGPRLESEYRPNGALDLIGTIGGLQRGPGDPTQKLDRTGGMVWRATQTPGGVATLALRRMSDGVVRLAAWGPGREWAIAQAPALCGASDDWSGFEPRHPLLAEALRRNPGLRLPRTDLPFDALAQVITEQKVTLRQAFGAWRSVVSRFGERAPGPAPEAMFAPPTPDAWRRVPSWAWHRAGLEPPQARTIVQAAERAPALLRAAEADAGGGTAGGAHDGPATRFDAAGSDAGRGAAPAPAERRFDRALASLPGVGPWTVAETRIRAFGDPDAVSVGDYHLAHQVGYALTGSRVDDDGMLELLAPWAGHRRRVIQLIWASGVSEPRRGAKVHMEDHRDR